MKNEEIRSEQEWLRKKLDGAGEIKLPASLSAEALFAGMDEQETVEADRSVKNNVIRPMWHRWGSIAAALVIVAGAAWVWQRTADLGAKAEAPQAAESAELGRVEGPNSGDSVNYYKAAEQPAPCEASGEDRQMLQFNDQHTEDPDTAANCVNSEDCGDYPAAIRVNGINYYSTNTAVSIEVDDSVIQYTTSYAENGVPEKDGEANFNRNLRSPYALIENSYVVVLIDHEWIKFEAE